MYPTTPKSKIFKIIGIVVAVLGTLGSIGMGFIFQIPKVRQGLYGTYTVGSDFNFIAMIAGLISIAILCLFIFGVAFALEYLEDIKSQLSAMDTNASNTAPIFKNISESAAQTPIKKATQPESDEWKCPVCGRVNKNYVGTCGCGQRK